MTYDRRMLRICTSLSKAGFDVWLVGVELPDSQLFDNQWIKAHRFKFFLNKGKLFYVEYNVRLFFWLLAQDVDIVCGVDLDSILPCYFSAKIRNILRGLFFSNKKKIRVVYDAHELFSETPEVVRRPSIRRMWLAIERFVVPKVDAAYTVSQSIADEFEQRYGQHFELIRNLPLRNVKLEIKNEKLMQSVDSELDTRALIDGVISNHPVNESINPTNSSLKKVVLYQGALNEGRGLDTAIEAMQFIENAELWLIGEGDLSQILRGAVARLGLENKVKFLGFIVPDALPFYTAKADIGLHISEDKGLSYRYSLANKFLDYIQSEVPQICTQFPEYQRLNEQFNVAILIEKTDVQLLVLALNRLLNDGEFYREIKENCRQAAAVLCWEKEEEKLINIYLKL